MVRRRARQGKSTVPATLKKRLRIVYKDLTDIIPYENNPRNNEAAVAFVKNSITQFGFQVPIILDANNVIVAGHTRHLAAIELGYTEVPCTMATDLTPQQIKAFRLVDNKVAEMATWNPALLSEEMSLFAGTGMDFTEFGWSQEDIDCLTDMVAEDCLSAGSAAATDVANNRRRVEHRAPSRARIVVGEFVFFVDQDVYRNWANAVRVEGEYSEEIITGILKDRLGITPYESGGRH